MPRPAQRPEGHRDERNADDHPRGGDRDRRLAEVKRQIESGEYETPEKLDVTVRRLLADLRSATETTASREDDSGGERP